LSYVIAKSIVEESLSDFGYSLEVDRNIIPNDDTTLFICSGMQNLKPLFSSPDGSKKSVLQSCIRTNDLEEVGDGSHLTYFEMMGNFSFGNKDYEESCYLWHTILSRLDLKVTHITYHPSQIEHNKIWTDLGYKTRPDEGNVWTDGSCFGYCSEVFCGELEIGNLVEMMGHSVDVVSKFKQILSQSCTPVLEGTVESKITIPSVLLITYSR